MNDFVINGIHWKIKYVGIDSPMLRRSDGSYTVGMTCWTDKTVYLCDRLYGRFEERVLCHELCHCICFSYDIHMDLEQEEFLADWISLFGRQVIDLLDDLLTKTMYKRGV